MNEFNTIGKKLKQFRQKSGLSQQELEDRIDAAYGSISRMETGKTNPDKETLLKLIEALDLNAYDAADLFNIDIGKEYNLLIEVSKKLETTLELEKVMDIIVNELVKMIDVHIASVFLWNEEKESLKLAAINVASSFRKIAEKVMGKSILEYEISKSKDQNLRNPLLRCCYEKKITESDDLYELTYPVFNKKTADFLQKILKLKLNVAIPLYVGDIRLGILSIIWKKEFIQTGELVLLNYFATQISKSLYNAIRYDDLNKKYMELQKELSSQSS